MSLIGSDANNNIFINNDCDFFYHAKIKSVILVFYKMIVRVETTVLMQVSGLLRSAEN